jgi:hypothetical protein
MNRETLQKLHTKIKNKRPGKLTGGNTALHDNARPHVIHRVQDEVNAMGREVPKLPVYSPDLLPCDFHVFEPLKKSSMSVYVHVGRQCAGGCGTVA